MKGIRDPLEWYMKECCVFLDNDIMGDYTGECNDGKPEGNGTMKFFGNGYKKYDSEYAGECFMEREE